MARLIEKALGGETTDKTPLWMMRQAGRYLPEYKATRAEAGSFLDLCYTPEFAVEVTMQPIRRFGFDAAILFSDILVIPDALGRSVRFVEGEGPQLDPINAEEIQYLDQEKMLDHLKPVFETVSGIRSNLDDDKTLLGFCGAPWTVATYMIAGKGTADQAPARIFAMRHPEEFRKLLDVLADVSARYLVAQIDAGADAVQIFDTWAGILGPFDFERFVIAPISKIVRQVKEERPDAKIIGFPRGAGLHYATFAEKTGVDAVGTDWMLPIEFIRDEVQPKSCVQGNLDPLSLIVGGERLDREIDTILQNLSDGPHIFNLGHGITPKTPIEHVERMVERVRSFVK